MIRHFRCIYCGLAPPDVEPSEAHIFPHVIGGSAFTNDTVCTGCNGLINHNVENPSLSAFDFFQSYFGITGRRGRIRPVRGTVSVEGREVPVYIDSEGKAGHPIVLEDTTLEGRKTYTVVGERERVEAAKREIAEKYPGLAWSDGEPFREMIFIEIEDLSRPHLRRLAAKVAFEHFASMFGAEAALGSEFEEVRKFVEEGTEATEPIVGVLSDEAHLTGPLDYPVLTHASFLIGNPEDRTLGGFVAFFGVFYYWVILSRSYQADGAFNRLLEFFPALSGR